MPATAIMAARVDRNRQGRRHQAGVERRRWGRYPAVGRSESETASNRRRGPTPSETTMPPGRARSPASTQRGCARRTSSGSERRRAVGRDPRVAARLPPAITRPPARPRAWPAAIGSNARRLAAPPLLQPQRHREQPAHRRVEAVVGAQPGHPARSPSHGSSTNPRTSRRLPGAPDAGCAFKAHSKKSGSTLSPPPSGRRSWPSSPQALRVELLVPAEYSELVT